MSNEVTYERSKGFEYAASIALNARMRVSGVVESGPLSM